MVFLLQRKMAQVACPKTQTSNWVWFALAVAILALIMVIVIYVFYFVERSKFIAVPDLDPSWNSVLVTPSNKTIDGENFTLYVITDKAGVDQGDVVTLNVPEGGSVPGGWFIVSNQNDKTVTVQAGTGVTFQSFPTDKTAGTSGNASLLPAKTSWIIAWLNTSGTALNLVPGDPNSSS